MTYHFVFSNSPDEITIAFIQDIKYMIGPWKTF